MTYYNLPPHWPYWDKLESYAGIKYAPHKINGYVIVSETEYSNSNMPRVKTNILRTIKFEEDIERIKSQLISSYHYLSKAERPVVNMQDLIEYILGVKDKVRVGKTEITLGKRRPALDEVNKKLNI